MATWTTPTAVHSKCGEGGATPATNAKDDDTGTYWRHGFTCYHWIIFDLGQTYAISKIRLYQSATAAHRWGETAVDGLDVFVSDDPADFGTAVWHGALNATGWQESGAFSKNGRYVKLVSKSNSQYQRMYEFDGYCQDPFISLAGAIAAGATVDGALTKTKELKGNISGLSSIQGDLTGNFYLDGNISGLSSATGNLGLLIDLKGNVSALSSISGGLTKTKELKGNISGLSSVTGSLINIWHIAGSVNAISDTIGRLTFPEAARIRGFYYAKLGTNNFVNPPDTDFNVTVEHNGIASFDFVIQNNAANRTIITDHLTEDFKIMRDDGTEILTGSIDSDRIEYFAEGEGGAGKRIRLSGYASFIDLAYLIYKRMADADAEAVGSVQDEDNSMATFTDYTTQANNDTINDVLPTFGAINDTLYIGKDETFFAIKTKYSTKGVHDLSKFGVANYAGPTGAIVTHNYNLSNYTAFITSTADAEAAVGETHINSINPNSFTIHNSGHGLSTFRWLIPNNPYDNGDSTFAGPGGQTVTHTKGDTNYVPCIIPSANSNGAIGEWWITDIANTSFVVRNSGIGLTAFKWSIPRFETGGKGASSFAGPNGVIIAHNLNISGDYIPLISPTENPNGHLGAVYVTDITANAFTVKNTGSAITTFSWIIADKGENTTVVIEYSKGGGVWATLDCIDESYAFTEDAGIYLFYIPNKADDWAKDTINGKNQYHIRFRITQGSYSTKPKLDRVWLSNADVCRVQFNEVAANTILGYVLADTGYSEDATDQCPADTVTIRGEYDSKLRWIFGLGSALTWEDGNGDKQRYDVWIDTSKKTHFKQQRGTDKGDLSGDFRTVNNKMGYHGIGTRIFGAGGYDGINQKRAIVEDTTAQATHKLREIVLEDSRITGYEALKAETQKSLTIRKAPLKEVSGDIDTKYLLDNSLSVGDKITINQPDWNLNDQELYIMRAVIDPSNTHLDLGTSQMHLEHMRSSLQRQMDINNVWMHGAVSTYISGPVEDNYQRVDDSTVYPVEMKIEIPSNARAINHVEISWTLSSYKSSVNPSSRSGGGHNHSHGGSGGGGGHGHGGSSDLDGGHITTIGGEGGHIHAIDAGGGVKTSIASGSYGSACNISASVYVGLHDTGCGDGGYCTNAHVPTSWQCKNFTTQYHTHNVNINHDHTESTEPDHAHSASTEPDHWHVIGTDTEPNHSHTVPDSNVEPDHEHTTDYGVHEEAGGTTLELYVNDVLVANNYVGGQSNINITGWVSTGSNTIKLNPIVGDNEKGRAEIWSLNTVFLENLK